jgi:hypothetical protein
MRRSLVDLEDNLWLIKVYFLQILLINMMRDC